MLKIKAEGRVNRTPAAVPVIGTTSRKSKLQKI